MAQYKAKYLQYNKTFVENDSFDLTFIILDENNDIVADLTNWNFKCEITDGSQELLKRDVNSGGSATQISKSGNKVTVHVVADDTDNWDGEDFEVELEMTHNTSGAVYTVFYKKPIEIVDERLDW